MGPTDWVGRTAGEQMWLNSQLGELRHHWGEAYEIECGLDGFRAKRRDGRGGWIIRDSADEMFAAILADYTVRPVPRTSS